MDWKVFATAFVSVFLAELGDKTQLATLVMASGNVSKLTVFAGSALALVSTSAIAVVAGEAVTRVISPELLEKASGVLFIALGLWTLFGRGEG